MRLVCGQEHDSRSALDTLPASLEGSFVLADKAYDSDRLRVEIARRGGLPVIPPKANRIDPPPYDKETGKLRHKVENLFCRLKRFRRVGTRYDQRADTYLGFVTLSAIIDWLRSPFVHAAYIRAGPAADTGGELLSNSAVSASGGIHGPNSAAVSSGGRGGASFGGQGFGKIEATFGVWDESIPFDKPSQTVHIDHVGTVQVPYNEVKARMAEFANVTNANNIAYTPAPRITGVGLNSNSYTKSFLKSMGFNNFKPSFVVPGWASGAPDRKALTYY
ncbi:MAG: transposase [Spirulinaceae cyanobacterium RM2_2_10]|nr:transposase [Spirulinaceae cyanobacterium RM2_2_10]